MEKRVVFRSAWLPYALLAPQLAITIGYFFWPAGQAIWYSFQLQAAFGLQTEFVGLQNFADLFADSHYLDSFKVTALFSVLVAGCGIAISLVLATMADRVVRGALAYKTLLIWPYAVAPAVAGVLWAFLFAPSIGILTFILKRFGVDWNWVIQGDQAMLLVVIASVWNQISYNFLFFLAGLQSIPKSLLEAAAIDGAGPMRRFWTIHPVFAEGQGTFANPIHLAIAAIAPGPSGYAGLLWTHMVLGCAGIHRLCRRAGASRGASLFAMAATSVTPLMMWERIPSCVMESVAWVPWSLCAMERWLQRPQLPNSLLLAGAVAMLALSGYPQILHGTALYLIVMLLTGVAADLSAREGRRRLRRKLGLGALAALLAAGLGAVQWLPQIELALQSNRAEGVAISTGLDLLESIRSAEHPVRAGLEYAALLFDFPLTYVLLWIGYRSAPAPIRTRHGLPGLLLLLIALHPLFPGLGELRQILGLHFFRYSPLYLFIVSIGCAIPCALGFDGIRPISVAMGVICWMMFGCAALAQYDRTYSLSYRDEEGRDIGGSMRLVPREGKQVIQ